MLGRLFVVVAQAFLKSNAEKKPSDKAKIMDAATSQCQYKMLISAVMRPTHRRTKQTQGIPKSRLMGRINFTGFECQISALFVS